MRGRLSRSRALACAVVSLACLWATGACQPHDDDDDDSSVPGDDDTGDDDLPFTYLRYDFEATVEGADASVGLSVAALDEERQTLCTYPIDFDAEYAEGADQGGALWASIDESLTLVGAEDPGTSDCTEEFGKPYSSEPADLIPLWSPLGFYSCDVAATDDSFLGDDPTGVGDGTFASYCNVTAPAVRGALPDSDLGEVEAIWLARGIEGQMDGYGDYAYLPAEDGSTLWYVFGLLFAGGGNGSEPVEGLSGHYMAVPLWVFVPY